jgi:hypothetical protein
MDEPAEQRTDGHSTEGLVAAARLFVDGRPQAQIRTAQRGSIPIA